MRNADSKIKSPQFDRYVYSFHRSFAATFSTASVKSRRRVITYAMSASPLQADMRELTSTRLLNARKRHFAPSAPIGSRCNLI
jgi:hypothetical protein